MVQPSLMPYSIATESGMSGVDEMAAKSNYFIGNDPKQWHTDVPNFAKVQYLDVYPGISLLYYGNEQQLEFDFVVAPGADPNLIGLDLQTGAPATQGREKGSTPVRIDTNGDLVSSTRAGEFHLRRPVAYQMVTNRQGATEKKLVKTSYFMKNEKQVGFQVGSYDKTRALVIDPIVVPIYSTYLGGAKNDNGFSIAVDGKGNSYITGSTASLNFPVIACIFCAYNGGLSVFL